MKKAELNAHMMDFGRNDFWAYDADDLSNEVSDELVRDIKQFNIYNYKEKCVGSLCYNLGFMRTFFRNPDLQKEIGIKTDKKSDWNLCDGPVGGALLEQDNLVNSALNLPAMLNGGVKVLFYTGVLDYICNWKGTEATLDALEWFGAGRWKDVQYTDGAYGKEKSYYNLRFVRFKDSGHLVPHDQPQLSLQMLNEFIN